MNIRTAVIAAIALGLAAPAVAQDDLSNAADSLGNAAEDVGNAAESTGDAISNTASGAVQSVDNAVDINVDPNANLATPDVDVTTTDNMMAPMDDTNMMTTTTSTSMVQEESDGGGRWGLLGLLGLAAFLFRPKKPAIHLDERTGRV